MYGSARALRTPLIIKTCQNSIYSQLYRSSYLVSETHPLWAPFPIWVPSLQSLGTHQPLQGTCAFGIFSALTQAFLQHFCHTWSRGECIRSDAATSSSQPRRSRRVPSLFFLLIFILLYYDFIVLCLSVLYILSPSLHCSQGFHQDSTGGIWVDP